MQISIRQENQKDHQEIFDLIEKAFLNENISDHKEQFLVEKLRKSTAFVPELSLVAIDNDKIVGHILLSKIQIVNDKRSFESLALAPVSVLPDFQNKGIGSRLILKAHEIAKDLGYQSVVVLGHSNFYPKFDYELTSKYHIKIPFDAPESSCMVKALVKGGLVDVSGTVNYAKEFYE